MDTHSGKPMSITRRQVGYWLLIIVLLQILGPGMGHELSIEVNRESGQVNLGAVIIHRIELLVDLLGLAGLACGLLCLWLDRSRLIWRCSIGLIIAQQVIIPAAIAWRRDITSYLHSSLISDELTLLFGTKTDSGHMRDSILSWCVLPCLAYVIWKLWKRGGEPAKTRPDFYLSSSEGYGLETPRACRCIRRMSLGDRANLMLVEISPALPVQTSGSGGRDVTLLLLAPRHAGRTLWPINEWPMHVHVVLPLIDDPAQRDRVEPDEVRHLAWAELNKELPSS